MMRTKISSGYLHVLPLEAKRTDGTHAVIYDRAGMLVAKMVGAENAFERAQTLCAATNAYSELLDVVKSLADLPMPSAIDAGLAELVQRARRIVVREGV